MNRFYSYSRSFVFVNAVFVINWLKLNVIRGKASNLLECAFGVFVFFYNITLMNVST